MFLEASISLGAPGDSVHIQRARTLFGIMQTVQKGLSVKHWDRYDHATGVSIVLDEIHGNNYIKIETRPLGGESSCLNGVGFSSIELIESFKRRAVLQPKLFPQFAINTFNPPDGFYDVVEEPELISNYSSNVGEFTSKGNLTWTATTISEVHIQRYACRPSGSILYLCGARLTQVQSGKILGVLEYNSRLYVLTYLVGDTRRVSLSSRPFKDSYDNDEDFETTLNPAGWSFERSWDIPTTTQEFLAGSSVGTTTDSCEPSSVAASSSSLGEFSFTLVASTSKNYVGVAYISVDTLSATFNIVPLALADFPSIYSYNSTQTLGDISETLWTFTETPVGGLGAVSYSMSLTMEIQVFGETTETYSGGSASTPDRIIAVDYDSNGFRLSRTATRDLNISPKGRFWNYTGKRLKSLSLSIITTDPVDEEAVRDSFTISLTAQLLSSIGESFTILSETAGGIDGTASDILTSGPVSHANLLGVSTSSSSSDLPARYLNLDLKHNTQSLSSINYTYTPNSAPIEDTLTIEYLAEATSHASSSRSIAGTSTNTDTSYGIINGPYPGSVTTEKSSKFLPAYGCLPSDIYSSLPGVNPQADIRGHALLVGVKVDDSASTVPIPLSTAPSNSPTSQIYSIKGYSLLQSNPTTPFARYSGVSNNVPGLDLSKVDFFTSSFVV